MMIPDSPITVCDGHELGFGPCRFAENSGCKLHYHELGIGPPMVLIHGFPEFWGAWCEIASDLAKDFRVIMPDMRGCNLSDAPSGTEAYRAETLAADVLTVLNAAGLQRAVVVSHDIGGVAAWHLIESNPASVVGLVLISSPHPVDHMKARAQAGDETYFERIVYQDGGPLRDPQTRSFWCSDPLLKERLKTAMTRSSPDALFSPYRANMSPDAAWHQGIPFAGPSLVIWGDRDPFVSSSTMEQAVARLPGAKAQIREGEGHFLNHSAAKPVAALIRNFANSSLTSEL